MPQLTISQQCVSMAMHPADNQPLPEPLMYLALRPNKTVTIFVDISYVILWQKNVIHEE